MWLRRAILEIWQAEDPSAARQRGAAPSLRGLILSRHGGKVKRCSKDGRLAAAVLLRRFFSRLHLTTGASISCGLILGNFSLVRSKFLPV